MDVSIIIPEYRPDKKILKRILLAIKNQKFKGKVEVLEISGGGLAENMNKGLRDSKHEIAIILHQDCIPFGRNWLKNLVGPFEDEKVVAATSKVHLPEKMWEEFDIFAKSMTVKEKGTITPLLDEKGCAYRKKSILGEGGFNEKDFEYAGEDFDMYIKLRKIGKIAYPNSEVIHLHPTNFKKRLKKELQYSNGFGALVRIHGKNMPMWYGGIIKAIPIIGIVWYLISYPFLKKPFYFFPYLLTIPFAHALFIGGFWKGFFKRKQTVK